MLEVENNLSLDKLLLQERIVQFRSSEETKLVEAQVLEVILLFPNL
jgi:hypothetical protein